MATGRGSDRELLWLAAVLGLGVVVSLGLARFAYSLLLPAMRDDLGWSYAQAGGMNTANAVGYLAGSVVTVAIARRIGTRTTYVAGIVIAALGLLLAAATSSYAAQLWLRAVVGVASALTFVGGGAIVARLGDRAPARSGLLLNVYTAGAGLGVVVSGLVVEPLLGADRGNWRLAWVVLALLSTLCLALVVPRLRRVEEPRTAARHDRVWPQIVRLATPAGGYFCFGLGYIAYVTFVVAYLKAHGASTLFVTVFWALLGLSVLAGVPAWGRLSDRMRTGHSLAAIHLVLVAGAVLPLLGGPLGAVPSGIASAVLFGSAFMAVPAGMAHLARRRLPPTAWSAGISGLTAVFAVGQVIGPALAGALADQLGGPGAGLVLAAAVLAVGGVVHLVGERLRPSPSPTGP